MRLGHRQQPMRGAKCDNKRRDALRSRLRSTQRIARAAMKAGRFYRSGAA